MPEKLVRTTYADDMPDDEEDKEIIRPSPIFTPSPKSRFDRLQTMPPPSETTSVASRALSKEFKGLIKLQVEGKLPFHIDPETDR